MTKARDEYYELLKQEKAELVLMIQGFTAKCNDCQIPELLKKYTSE